MMLAVRSSPSSLTIVLCATDIVVFDFRTLQRATGIVGRGKGTDATLSAMELSTKGSGSTTWYAETASVSAT